MAKGSLKGLRALVIARLREFRREPSAFFFVLFMPILWMAILGPAFSHQTRETFKIGFDTSTSSERGAVEILRGLKGASTIKVFEKAPESLMTDLRRGGVQLIVRAVEGHVEFQYDPLNRDSQRARVAVDNIIQVALGRQDPIPTQDRVIDVPGTRYVDFLIPGLLGVSILSTSIWGVGMTIVSNRKENLLKRLLATPLRAYDYILSHVIGRCVILLLEVGSQLLAAGLIFKFRVAGSLGTYFFFALLGAATLTAFGIMLGARTANTGAMNGIANLVSLPMMILSGAWFSRGNLPDWLAEATRFLPLSPLVDGLRSIALEGAGLADLTFEMAVLGGYFTVFSLVAARLFKWY
jgi:ABC-2 type transport system permease protein